ncbi:hypothetical protein [Halioxenophilus sp. WMMB6]|uniref:hypothetical protein n=1 Tax=Halioxenophilus sp. WMMB6 TaxID=3073815 RepID=UPI00295EA8C2|nr:hypothetical protein [Halioxenophilus sp. WMMB6]
MLACNPGTPDNSRDKNAGTGDSSQEKSEVIGGQLQAGGVAMSDPLFQEAYIDIDELRLQPSRHRYIHGGFKNSDARFSFYFPPAEQYQGRFYQYVTPVPDSENLSQGQSGESDKIGFAFASGAYFVETNSGGAVDVTAGQRVDPTIGAFRANAAAAEYSRHLAKQIYSSTRPYGYIFGGSGGAFRTIAGFENAEGVWDGAVPFVVGSPMSLPNVFTVRTYVMRVLGDKLPAVADALDVGSNVELSSILNAEELAAFNEATRLGFPPAGWQLHEHLGLHAFAVIYPIVAMIDPGYFTDFWSKPGYEGFDGSDSLSRSILQAEFSVAQVILPEDAKAMGLEVGALAGQPKGRADDAWQALQAQKNAQLPVAIRLDQEPAQSVLGADLIVTSGAAKDQQLIITRPQQALILLDSQQAQALADIAVGDKLMIDNHRFLAVQTYHRHQVPENDFAVWDQFRSADGQPLYPQRPILGPMLARGATGTAQTGVFKGKMILLENLHDTEAFPWQGDWYRQQVQKNLGSENDNHFRIWMTDHANHGDFTEQKEPTQTVSYLGVLQQALRDLSHWVEAGEVPPASSQYQVDDGQIVVPGSAQERLGIQPVITLTANGGQRAEVAPGAAISLVADVELPPNAGSLVTAEWDLDGSGEFATAVDLEEMPTDSGTTRVTLTTHYPTPGTYFPVLRVASERDGDSETPFARVQNLARVRVVVE